MPQVLNRRAKQLHDEDATVLIAARPGVQHLGEAGDAVHGGEYGRLTIDAPTLEPNFDRHEPVAIHALAKEHLAMCALAESRYDIQV